MGIPNVEVSPELISAVAGMVLSLIFSYAPRLNTKFAALEAGVKRLIMAGLLILVTAGLFGLGCSALIVIPGFSCTQGTAVQYTWMLIYALAANQTTYSISPETSAVRRVKLSRGLGR